MTLLFILFIFSIIGIAIFKATKSTITLGADFLGLAIEPIVSASSVSSLPTSITLKEPMFNSDNIQEYTGDSVKIFEFRPQTWEQFIGQKEAKEMAKTIIKKAKRNIKCHFIVNGIKGHGKTTFVKLLAKSLNAKIIERIGKQIDEENIVDIINEINNSSEQYVMLFIDEIDTMDWKVVKVLNPIIEEFKINGKKIKPFIFACATINKHELVKNNPDTLDRIPTHIKFERYNAEEIATILKQYHTQLYAVENVADEIIIIISNNSKFNPRTSIALLEDYIVEQNINKVLRNSNIIYNGLNITDIKILTILSKQTRAIGANALAMKAGLSQSEYLTEYEPFLVEYDYINRIPSRVLTEKGKQILKGIK